MIDTKKELNGPCSDAGIIPVQKIQFEYLSFNMR
jgi:hypothetical protein